MNTAVITGASSGIGELTAKELAKKGYNVVLAARRESILHDIAAECRQYGVEALVVHADISKKEQVERVAAKAIERFGGFNVWINNAGVIIYGRFLDIPPEEFRQTVETNLFGCVYGAREALTQFRAQGHGKLINVASGYGAVPSPFVSPYVASKFAVRGFSASLRQELQADDIKDIHVCTVLPATMDTPVYENGANRLGYQVRALPPVTDPAAVSAAILRVIDNPKAEVSVGAFIRIPIILFNAFPGGFGSLFAKYVKALGYKKDVAAGISAGNLFESSENTGIRGGWSQEGSKPGSFTLPVIGIGLLLLVISKLNRRQHE